MIFSERSFSPMIPPAVRGPGEFMSPLSSPENGESLFSCFASVNYPIIAAVSTLQSLSTSNPNHPLNQDVKIYLTFLKVRDELSLIFEK